MGDQRTVRCAIYTRKSSEEGLEQAFNSLDAQREACVAYIESQRHEGWKETKMRYDDGGYSGGTLERPGIKRLLEDIRTGKIDTVVVYKVDRLTRSLADFAKIVEIFDAHKVAFVSITQHFNTTTSMGRLTLNVLLSFAQFEREVTGERIRDKIAASKRKGLWMGGPLPLGYDAKERKLIVNEAEAETVRHIYRRYVELGNVRALQADLHAAGITSKRWLTASGRVWGGKHFSRGALYALLQNPIYIGRIRHKDQTYPGEHAAIVPQDLWNQAQTLRESQTVERPADRLSEQSLLTGLLYDTSGQRFTPSHTLKQGKRYRYYVCGSNRPGTAEQPIRRIPAQAIEEIVLGRLGTFFANGNEILDALALPTDSALIQQRLITAGKTKLKLVSSGTFEEKQDLLRTTFNRITVHEGGVDLHLERSSCRKQLLHPSQSKNSDTPFETPNWSLTIKVHFRRYGGEVKLVIPGESSSPSQPQPSLCKALVRAHLWYERLCTGNARSLRDIAKEEVVNDRYVSRILRLVFLAPDIVDRILKGNHSPDWTLHRLFNLPNDWSEQRQRLAVAEPQAIRR